MDARNIYELAKAGQTLPDLSVVQKLDKDGLAPIHYAAMVGDDTTIERLVNAGVDQESLCSTAETPFDIAVDHGYFDTAGILIGDKLLVEPRPSGYNALDLAAMTGHTNAAKFLISLKAKVNGAEDLRSPLTWAVQEGHFETVQLLIAHGADILKVAINSTDTESALSLAVGDGNLRMTELLVNALRHQRTLDKSRLSEAIEIGISYGNLDCVELIHQLNN